MAAVYVIKPDNFWDRQKTSASAGKYKKLDVQMISVDELTKYIDAHQIVRQFGGSLSYDHDEWLDLRLVSMHSAIVHPIFGRHRLRSIQDIEKLVWRMSETLRHFDAYAVSMSNEDTPVNAENAQSALTEHENVYSLISAVSIDALKTDVDNVRLPLLKHSFLSR